jgi:hypothetical protein
VQDKLPHCVTIATRSQNTKISITAARTAQLSQILVVNLAMLNPAQQV